MLPLAYGAFYRVSVGCQPDSRSARAQGEASDTAELPKAAKPGVRQTMSRHAQHASALTQAVALGNDQVVVQEVRALLEEPRLARPLPGDDTLNQELPPALFPLDDRFRSALEQLREAAARHDDEATLAGFGEVVRACRTCHEKLRPPQKADTPAQKSSPR
jgi:hypothetical protein